MSLPAEEERRYFTFSPLGLSDLVLTRAEGFSLKNQADVALGLNVDVYPLPFLGIGASYRYHWTLPSGSRDGYVYRGTSGSEVRTFLAACHPRILAVSSLILAAGTDIGVLLRLDSYQLTSLYFIYPGVYIQPFLDLILDDKPGFSFRLFLSLDYFFRKDLLFNASAGPGIAFRISPF